MVTPMAILDVVESPPCEVEEEADNVTVGSVPIRSRPKRIELKCSEQLGISEYIATGYALLTSSEFRGSNGLPSSTTKLTILMKDARGARYLSTPIRALLRNSSGNYLHKARRAPCTKTAVGSCSTPIAAARDHVSDDTADRAFGTVGK